MAARPRLAHIIYFGINLHQIKANNDFIEASKTRSVRKGVKERTQTYVTEHTRKRDTVLRRLYDGRRSN